MKYQGGKHYQAKRIAAVIQEMKGHRTRYVEPFVGGASVLAATHGMFKTREASDINLDLILFWTAVQAGWEPPVKISIDRYYKLKYATNPSPLRAWAACAASYAGKWFHGYVTKANGITNNRDYLAESFKTTMKKKDAMQDVTFRCMSYRRIHVDENTVVYCDPPYEGTTPYSGAPLFNSTRFWETASTWAKTGALVLVSEYTVPESQQGLWVSVNQKIKRESLSLNGSENPKTEHLYSPRFDYYNMKRIIDLYR